MASIHFTQTDFDFATLTALTPVTIVGGAHLSKFRVNDSTPFYLQLPKCRTKQGIVKTSGGKKFHCDLVFTHENEHFIRWMERLEEYTRKVLFDNRQKWFSTELNEHDIETLFVSPLKLYKSGKCYLLRVNVPSSPEKNGCALKIYDENQSLVSLEEVKEDTQVITVVEIQGIKCASMSFYLEMEVKQMMVVTPVDQSFEMGCVIAKEPPHSLMKNPIQTLANLDKSQSSGTPDKTEVSRTPDKTKASGIPDKTKASGIPDKTEVSGIPDKIEVSGIPDKTEVSGIPDKIEASGIPDKTQASGIPDKTKVSEISNENLEEDVLSPEIQEYDIDLEKTSKEEVFQIKKRNDVYYEMYREAKRKARLARDLAISSYLEAKRIKNTFLARDANESDLEDDDFYHQRS